MSPMTIGTIALVVARITIYAQALMALQFRTGLGNGQAQLRNALIQRTDLIGDDTNSSSAISSKGFTSVSRLASGCKMGVLFVFFMRASSSNPLLDTA